MHALEALETGVRTYSRSFPAVFCRACGSIMLTEDGQKVIDFLCGAGTLKGAITDYLASDAVVHGLAMATLAKLEFMETFNSVILRRRDLQYRFQFTGPTGANAIEAAIELLRKVTGRQNIVCFTNGYHGMSLGAITASGNRYYRKASGVCSSGVTFMPYDAYGPQADAANYFAKAVKEREQWH